MCYIYITYLAYVPVGINKRGRAAEGGGEG